MVVELERRHFTLNEYERMVAAGILQEDERVELLDGEIEDILLLIEVADSSVAYHRRKLVRYARAGICEAWLVNLVDGHVEIHTEPGAEGYRAQRVLRLGDSVDVLGISVAAGEVLGECPPA
jgi:Putative restriction endonuclease